MSANNASAPVTVRKIAPSTRKPTIPWVSRNRIASCGLKARMTDGSCRTDHRPIIARARNQTAMIGPNAAPTRAVPCDCTANRATRSAIEIISTWASWICAPTPGTDFSPSTADRTEIAGVIAASP
jgi:hypothetical protein